MEISNHHQDSNIDNEVYDQLFSVIRSNETNNFYGLDVQIERSKLKEIEAKSKPTLKDGQDIKRNPLSNLFNRKNILYLGKFVCEQPLEISTARGETALSIINQEEISSRIRKMKKEDQPKITYIHISTIQIIIKSTYASIETPLDLIIIDNRIISANPQERVLGMIKGNLKYGTIKFNVSVQFAIPLATKNLSQSIGILYNFRRQELMEVGDYPLSITYVVGYALSNSHHSLEYINKDIIEIDELFRSTSTQLVTFDKKSLGNTLFKSPSIRTIAPRPSLSIESSRPSTSIGNTSRRILAPPNLHNKKELNQEVLEKQIQDLTKQVNKLDMKI